MWSREHRVRAVQRTLHARRAGGMRQCPKPCQPGTSGARSVLALHQRALVRGVESIVDRLRRETPGPGPVRRGRYAPRRARASGIHIRPPRGDSRRPSGTAGQCRSVSQFMASRYSGAIAAGQPNDRIDDLLPWKLEPPSNREPGASPLTEDIARTRIAACGRCALRAWSLGLQLQGPERDGYGQPRRHRSEGNRNHGRLVRSVDKHCPPRVGPHSRP